MGPAKKKEPEKDKDDDDDDDDDEEKERLAPRGSRRERGQAGTGRAARSAPMAASSPPPPPPAELSQEAVLTFLAERGGRARNADLLEHFRGVLHSPEPQRRAQARERFKELVNAVATVRQEPGSGAKYVQLRKKYRRAAAGGRPEAEAEAAAPLFPAAAGDASVTAEEAPRLPPPEADGEGEGSNRRRRRRKRSSGGHGGAAATTPEAKAVAEEDRLEAAKAGGGSASPDPSGEPPPPPEEGAPSEPRRQQQPEVLPPDVPPPPSRAGGRAEEEAAAAASGSPRAMGTLASEGDEAAEAEGEPPVGAAEEEEEEDASPGSPPPSGSTLGALPTAPAAAAANTPRCGRKPFRERMLGSSPQMKRGGGGGGGGGVLSRGGSGSSRGGGGGGGGSGGASGVGGDSDSASLASSSAEEEGGGSVALDPLEHAWMLCASDGRWESLEGLLSCEPALLAKRDFITGFSCLHWAAKHGRHELLALLVNFAHRHRLPVNINARTSGGYTALHLAAMHGHLEVVKLLVGAYDADVEVRDYSGRKAAHYLSRSTAQEVRSLVGALQEEGDGGAPNGSGRWRLSRVLPANLITYKLSHHLHHGGEEGEAGEGAGAFGKGKELSRKTTSGSGRIKPRLNKIRFRTQIIHTTPSFRGDAEEEGQEERTLKGSFKLRPKSNVFG